MSAERIVTIDGLLRERRYAAPERWAQIAEFTEDGVRLGSQPYLFVSFPDDMRLIDDQAELFHAAQALAQLGYRAVDLHKRESPDFTVAFPDGARVGLEVAEVVHPASARFWNAVQNVRVGLRERLRADTNLREAAAGRSINFNVWYAPSRSAERRLVEEMARYIASTAGKDQSGTRLTAVSAGVKLTHPAG